MAFQITVTFLILCTQYVSYVASSDSSCQGNITVSPNVLKILATKSDHFTLSVCNNWTDSLTISFISDNEKIATVQENITIKPYSAFEPYKIRIEAHSKGSTELNMTTTNTGQLNVTNEHVQVTVIQSEAVDIIAVIIGWVYFFVWSISFYPQVWLNFRRKSVVGLSFDFLAYNFTGFLAYAVFNVGLYWIDPIKEEYKKNDPYSNPVQLNDVVFALHALFITCVTIFQTFIYERGGQKVTVLCWTLQSIAYVFVAVILIITAVSEERLLNWLQFVTFISYIKLGVTLIKYIPQVWMNFRRKSTVGWSIGNVLLDFTGGAFSILQMILLSYNSNDWSSFFGDPTKFGLGLFSICFDIVFILQHYVWYRGKGEEEDTGNSDVERLINADSYDD